MSTTRGFGRANLGTSSILLVPHRPTHRLYRDIHDTLGYEFLVPYRPAHSCLYMGVPPAPSSLYRSSPPNCGRTLSTVPVRADRDKMGTSSILLVPYRPAHCCLYGDIDELMCPMAFPSSWRYRSSPDYWCWNRTSSQRPRPYRPSLRYQLFSSSEQE